MSGGYFDYDDGKILEIAEDVERLVKGGVPDYSCMGEHIGRQTLEQAFGEEVARHFRDAVRVLREAYVYAHRIDWLMEGDDGADTFCAALAEQLPKCAAKDWEAER